MFRHYNKLSTETTLRLTMQSSLFYIEMGHILSTYCSFKKMDSLYAGKIPVKL